ncbi:hypothetical protein F5I97DRAFT_104890 [Phlebopus sp. FC_14]|nr:hypothetical protein F5I97DRAFT_104890 [Phlebopus sp. FC_14]
MQMQTQRSHDRQSQTKRTRGFRSALSAIVTVSPESQSVAVEHKACSNDIDHHSTPTATTGASTKGNSMFDMAQVSLSIVVASLGQGIFTNGFAATVIAADLTQARSSTPNKDDFTWKVFLFLLILPAFSRASNPHPAPAVDRRVLNR